MTNRLLILALPAVFVGQGGREQAPLADSHQHLFSPTIAARSSGTLEPIDAAALVRLLGEAVIRQALVLSLASQHRNPNRPPVENEYDDGSDRAANSRDRSGEDSLRLRWRGWWERHTQRGLGRVQATAAVRR